MKKIYVILLIMTLVIISSCKINSSKITPNSLDELSEDINIEEQEFGISIGNVAPDFELENYDGTSVRLSDFKGKPIIVDFFATWCPFCNNEMPRINQLITSKYPEVVMIGVDDAFEDPETIKKWALEKNFDFPLLVDPNGKVKSLYAVRSHPTTYYIDKNGIIKDKRYGSATNNVIEGNIKLII